MCGLARLGTIEMTENERNITDWPKMNAYSIACEQWSVTGVATKSIQFIGRKNLVEVVKFLNDRGAIFLIDTWSDGVFSVTVGEYHIDELQSFIETLDGASM